jgi:hypothetical protein
MLEPLRRGATQRTRITKHVHCRETQGAPRSDAGIGPTGCAGDGWLSHGKMNHKTSNLTRPSQLHEVSNAGTCPEKPRHTVDGRKHSTVEPRGRTVLLPSDATSKESPTKQAETSRQANRGHEGLHFLQQSRFQRRYGLRTRRSPSANKTRRGTQQLDNNTCSK